MVLDVFEPGSGGVPLTKDVIATRKIFFIGFYEFLRESGQHVFIHNDKTDAVEQTIYTVPDNKTLYITNASISGGWAGDTGGEHCKLAIQNVAAELIIVDIFPKEGLGAGSNDSAVNSQSFNIPIKLEAGEKLRHDNASNSASSVIVIGFLVDKKISFI